MGQDDVVCIALPMMHAAGMNCLLNCMLTGAVACLVFRFDPDLVLDTMERENCTTFGGLPFMCAAVARSQHEKARRVPALQKCITVGDVCPEHIEDEFQRIFKLPLLSMWAASEDIACCVPASMPGPFTIFLKETEIKLVDKSGLPMLETDEGEAIIRSTSTTPGYWIDMENIDPLPDGWFHTGDLMRRNPDGHLYYVGRVKDLIVRGGSNISPSEIEKVIRRRTEVKDVVVAGISDPEFGHRVGAILVLSDGFSSLALPSILAGVRLELADYKVPERVAVLDTLPRNALTKIDRRAAAKLIGEHGIETDTLSR